MSSTLHESEVLLMLVALLFVRPVPSSGSAGRHVGESGMIWDGTVLQVQSIVEGSGIRSYGWEFVVG